MFSSKLKKQKAIDAYESLSELLQGAYFSKAMEILAALENVEAETGSAAVGGFFGKFHSLFNTLEDINPAFSARMTRFTVCRKSWREKYRNRTFSRTVFCANCVAIRNGA